MRHLFIAILLSAGAGWVAAADTFPDSDKTRSLAEIGQRIYLEGITESGDLLRGESAAKITFSGKQAACVQCHRKSGLGTSEGKSNIRPITGEYLFPAVSSEQTATTVKPAQSLLRWRERSKLGAARATYTQQTFARALREGVDGAGESLDKLMPRYTLSDNEVAALEAYLKTLSLNSDPGVDQETIHFATVILPGVDPQQAKAMLDVLRAFVADMNSETRSEKRRRTAGTEVMYRSYRRWDLQVWNLTGSADGWNEQLEQLYRKQPVFALLSGIGGANWKTVHDFCEQRGIPCLFPNANLPVTDGGYYSFYFSRGVTLEADVLARHISENKRQYGSIVQVFRNDDQLGAEAATIVRSNLKQINAEFDIFDWTIPANLSVENWQEMLKQKRPQTLVLWVNREDLARLGGFAAATNMPPQIYLSASMLGDQARDASLAGKLLHPSRDNLRLIYPYDLPEQSALHSQRIKRWLSARHIALTEERIQANTYFAAMVVGDSISHLLGHYSRDYFIERVEHMVGRSLLTSVYPRLTLGPGQRFASRGAYLLRYASDPKKGMQPVTEWIVP